MGLFSKIKNYITGGAAEVAIVFEADQVDGSQPIRLFISAIAKDDCKIKQVYFKVKGVESYKERVVVNNTNSDGSSSTSTRDETHEEVHHREEQIVAEELLLKAGSEEKWLVTFELPESAIATYHGKEVSFRWKVFAGLDMPGNDPDSGWVEFVLAKKMNYSPNQV